MHDLGRLHPHHRDRELAAPTGGASRGVALGILSMCALTAGIDMTITNVALPFIGRALDAPTNELQWTVDAYNIAVAGLLVLGGALADRYGRRRIFLLSYSLFALASLAAALSSSAIALIAARGVMGVGVAGVTAPALAIIASMYAPEERAGPISTFVVFGATGLAVGPILGGLLLDHFWWGAVFLVNVPIVATGVVVGRRVIPESRAPVPPDGPPPLDVVGSVASVVGLAALTFGVIEGPGRGWTSPAVLVGLLGGVAVLAGFVVRELRIAAPLFDVRILTRRAVAAGSVTLLVAYMLFNSFLFLNPQYLQDVRGESIVSVGLLLTPFAIVFGLCSLRAQHALARFGPRATIVAGLLTSGVAAVVFALTLQDSLWAPTVASILLGAGLSLLIAPPSTVVMNALPAAKAGDGSSLNFVSRFVGASIGIGIIGSILAALYSSDIEGAVGGLDASEAAAAEGSLQGALEVAETLGSSERASLTGAARDAFDRGASGAYLTVAILAAAAAAIAWFALGGDRAPAEAGAEPA